MYRDLANAIIDKNTCTTFCFSIIAVEATLTFLNAKRSEYSLTVIKSNTNNLHQQKIHPHTPTITIHVAGTESQHNC